LTIEQNNPGNLDPADWAIVMELLQAIKEVIPDIADRKPGEVLSLTLDALRAHSGKVVDSRESD
jgi:hypothetical protein